MSAGQVNFSATTAADPDRWAWLSRIALGLLATVVIARALTAEALREPLGMAIAGAPRSAGPATGLFLDLALCVPALLVLLRRALDRSFRLVRSWSFVPLAALAILALVSTFWSTDRFGAIVLGMHFASGAVVLWSAAQLVHSWGRFRVVTALGVGLLAAYFAQAANFHFVDRPNLREFWEKNRDQLLAQRGLESDDFAARQLERRVLGAELMGFFSSPNTLAAVTAMLLVIVIGFTIQRLVDAKRGGEDQPVPDNRPKDFDVAPWLLVLLIPLAGWIIRHTESKTAIVTPVLALGMLGAIYVLGPLLARHARAAFAAGAALVGLGLAAVMGHGLFHGTLPTASMAFRWSYWVGAWRIVEQNPILGVGWGAFPFHYLQTRVPRAAEEIKDPHNFLVRFATELGVLGLLLVCGWLLLQWRDLTRPGLPGEKPAGGSRGMNVMLVVASISILGAGLSVFTDIDLTADSAFVFIRIIERMLYCCVLVIIACAAALRSIREQTIDERPAPWIFYAVLAAIGIFFLHNLVDFSMFEPGPLVLLMFFMGSAMGLRIGATAAGGEPGGRYPSRLILLALALTLWIGALAAIWAPTAIAEDLAADGRSALARQQPQAAANLFMKAADRQPLNADYPHFAATALAAAKSAMPAIESAIQRALAQNPLYLDPLHLRVRLYLERTPEDVERISATYSRILELNPNDLPTRIEFADYLWSHGRQDEALGHYQRAVSLNGQLDPTEPERLSDQDLERAQARIGGA